MSNRLVLKLLKEQKERESHDFVQKTKKAPTLDGNGRDGEPGIPELSMFDIEITHFLTPTVDDQLTRTGSSLDGRSIMEEISQSKRVPFVEGTPIGAYKKRPAPRRYTDAEVRDYWVKRREWVQEELTKLRHRNDLNMARVIRREL